MKCMDNAIQEVDCRLVSQLTSSIDFLMDRTDITSLFVNTAGEIIGFDKISCK